MEICVAVVLEVRRHLEARTIKYNAIRGFKFETGVKIKKKGTKNLVQAIHWFGIY